MNEDPRGRDRCPVCTSPDPRPILDLKGIPVLCNVLWDDPEEARRVARGRIELSFCTTCGHLFNASFDPERIDYDVRYENSLHRSSRFQGYAESLAEDLVDRHDLVDASVLEVGCGQGEFLELLCEQGVERARGYDPSYRAGSTEHDERLRIFRETYDPDPSGGESAAFVCCRHVIEHLDEPGRLVDSLTRSPDGNRAPIVFVEVPNAASMMARGAVWDLIYEHVSYFTPPSLRRLFEEHELELLRLHTVFGDQFLTGEGRQSSSPVEPRDSGDDIDRLHRCARDFSDRLREARRRWERRLARWRRRDETAVLWGAGSKGVTFANLVEESKALPGVVDINPEKQGHFLTGTGHLIVGPERLRSIRPDRIVLMNPIYREEVGRTLDRIGVSAELTAAWTPDCSA